MTESFIENQFPVSKISKESYKERKANNSQTLTGLGKWWGRKPLVLVRAAILGCLMPATENPRRDMEIFLKIMSMDNSGLWLRHKQSVQKSEDFWSKWEKDLHDAFINLGYDDKLESSVRPEQFERNSCDHEWNEINHHLGTHAYTLHDLLQQLSIKRYGDIAIIGDCFCGGGSVPFEAARMGLNVYASDLNPVASLLTWSAINVCGASQVEMEKIKCFQKEVYDSVDQKITALGIEHNEIGDRAVAYLYCVEVTCPECGVSIPMAPSWVIGKGTKTVAQIKKNGMRFDITVKTNATDAEMNSAEAGGTATAKGLSCPNCGNTTPMSVIRRDRKDINGNQVFGLRRWERSEFEPRPNDTFQERLYCIKYEKKSNYGSRPERYYRAPNERDIANEDKVRKIVSENIVKWQEQELIPSMVIESGYNTDQVIRERGWTYWNHLFNARQLLVLSNLATKIQENNEVMYRAVGILGFHKCIDWNSRLSRWHPGVGNEKSEQTFYNQALNTMMNWGTRSLHGASTSWFFDINAYATSKTSICEPRDARNINKACTIWITDPPYSDAVNYHELSEFFLAWDKRLLKEAFPDWYTDSKRVLAVRGDINFAQSMIDIYSNLTKHMPNDGMQVVMFTHSDPAVWAQLALIMWKAGLKVTAAWNIATETDASGLKDGNYVKGTVLLVLRKRTGTSEAFLDEINTDIRSEVVRQIESMQQLDDKEDPNFSDPDYVLAAYAASMKVLTAYSSIGELDLDYELDKAINDPKNSKVVALIERAKKQAYDCIIPIRFDNYLWKELTSAEKFYIKGLEYEKAGSYQISTYQEYARGFAITNYSQLMANERANTCRLKTATEFAMRTVSEVSGFEESTLRLVLAAIHVAIAEDEQPTKGLWHLKSSLPDYWGSRDMLKQLLLFLKDAKDITNMPHWREAAQMAEHIYVLVDNDHV